MAHRDPVESGDDPNVDHEKAVDRLLGDAAGDDTMPASPGRRRRMMIFGMIFAVLILVFLVWFSATHTDRSEPGSFFGSRGVPVPVTYSRTSPQNAPSASDAGSWSEAARRRALGWSS